MDRRGVKPATPASVLEEVLPQVFGDAQGVTAAMNKLRVCLESAA